MLREVKKINFKMKSGGTRVERKKKETRDKIIDVSIDLFRKQGFNNTTMEQIAREVDIAKGTLYNYFPVREAIIDEYIKQSFKYKNAERIQEMCNMPDTRSRMIWLFNLLIEGVQEQKDFFEQYIVYRMQKMVSFHQDEDEKSGFNVLAKEVIQLGQKGSEIRCDIPEYVLEDLFEFSFIEVVKQFYIESVKFDTSEVIEACVDLFINAVRISQ